MSNIVQSDAAEPGAGVSQVLHLPPDTSQKLSAGELVKAGPGMVPAQVTAVSRLQLGADRPSFQIVSSAAAANVLHTSRPQDAIASILASMNTGGAAEHAEYGEVVSLVTDQGEARVQEVPMPLNLATSEAQVATIQQPQTIQVQGYRKLAQASPVGGGLITKKVIIATINGQQRILTPVSSPQLIAVKSPNGGAPRLVSADSLGGPLTIVQQKPVIQKQVIVPAPVAAPATNTSPQNKTSDNKTCRWKFENGQICGKVFTKTYNLTVHMRMHQDIRPFPCTICEQTFRQKAHLQRHEATHGIDSTAGRKRRKKSLLDGLSDSGLIVRREEGRMSESEEEDANGSFKQFDAKRPKLTAGGALKTENDVDLDPMIEPIEGSAAGARKLCPVTVGTNTEITPDIRQDDLMDDLEEDMEPVRYKGGGHTTLHVEQGVQYCEADLLPQEEKFAAVQEQEAAAGSQAATMTEFIQTQDPGAADTADTDIKNMKTELVYASQGGHYVNESGEFIEDPGSTAQLIAADGSFIDASSNHLVMSDGALVSLVSAPEAEPQPQENVVNIVTSNATNEQGQQIIIIENMDQHSPELQREIMNALLADHTIVPISQ